MEAERLKEDEMGKEHKGETSDQCLGDILGPEQAAFIGMMNVNKEKSRKR